MNTLLRDDVLTGTGGTLRGSLLPGLRFTGLSRDSRTVRPGDLYWAITGERLDGHRFVAEAAARGAAAAVVATTDLDVPEDFPLIVVDDTTLALQRLAAEKRTLMRADVVGITGSVGKTSAKEAVASVLAERRSVYRSPGSYNNEIGLPLSILEADIDVEAMVLEIGGAYAFGEIRDLAMIARPNVGVVTNIHPVHLERMGTIEAIAETKAELVDAIPADGTVVLNGDDPRVLAMVPRARGRVILYGLGEHNDVRATDIEPHGLDGTALTVHVDGGSHAFTMPLVGAHGVQIALSALAVGHAFGMDVPAMLPGLSGPGVQVRLVFLDGPNGSRLIDDTYNASTPSVTAALGVLGDARATRRIAVLGEMRELGTVSEREHRTVGRHAADVADVLFTLGPLADPLAGEARETRPRLDCRSFGLDDREALIAALLAEIQPGDVVLLKGSRGLEMETIVRALTPPVPVGLGRAEDRC